MPGNVRVLVVVVVVFLFKFILGCTGTPLLREGFSLAAASGGSSSLQCGSFSLWWFLLLWSMASRAQTPWLWHMDFIALWHVESSLARVQTWVPYSDSRVLVTGQREKPLRGHLKDKGLGPGLPHTWVPRENE